MASPPNWKALATVSFSFKPFVQESSLSANFHERYNVSICNVSGDNGRAAYEEVLTLPSEETKHHCPENEKPVELPIVIPDPSQGGHNSPLQPKKLPICHLNKTQWVNFLMKEASANNVQGIKKLLGEEKEVNVTDQFGWTMLMCASHAGAFEVVKFLVEIGADVRVRDKGGNTCATLAKRQKHYAILDLLKNYPLTKEASLTDNNQSRVIFCEICKQKFEETPSSLHKNSTLHLFNSHPRRNVTWYGIPDNNKGFKLMVKSGWNREQGLGPDGSGNKFPPKTVLKQDRKGLGIKPGIARVTHFKPHETRAIEFKKMNRTHHRRDQNISIKTKCSLERRKERYLRRELNF